MAEILAPERRSALRYVGGLFITALGVMLLAPALSFLSDPLRRRRGKAAAGPPPLPVAQLDEVPDLDSGAAPLRAVVIASELRDAWNRFESTKLGSVFLGKRSGELHCLSTTCPHAGCAIDFDEKNKQFVCPCHNSTFALDGSRRAGPSPRDMDTLEVSVQDKTVYCQFQRFRLAVGGKVPA